MAFPKIFPCSIPKTPVQFLRFLSFVNVVRGFFWRCTVERSGKLWSFSHLCHPDFIDLCGRCSLPIAWILVFLQSAFFIKIWWEVLSNLSLFAFEAPGILQLFDCISLSKLELVASHSPIWKSMVAKRNQSLRVDLDKLKSQNLMDGILKSAAHQSSFPLLTNVPFGGTNSRMVQVSSIRKKNVTPFERIDSRDAHWCFANPRLRIYAPCTVALSEAWDCEGHWEPPFKIHPSTHDSHAVTFCLWFFYFALFCSALVPHKPTESLDSCLPPLQIPGSSRWEKKLELGRTTRFRSLSWLYVSIDENTVHWVYTGNYPDRLSIKKIAIMTMTLPYHNFHISAVASNQ
jgi:hypothetical protein